MRYATSRFCPCSSVAHGPDAAVAGQCRSVGRSVKTTPCWEGDELKRAETRECIPLKDTRCALVEEDYDANPPAVRNPKRLRQKTTHTKRIDADVNRTE